MACLEEQAVVAAAAVAALATQETVSSIRVHPYVLGKFELDGFDVSG